MIIAGDIGGTKTNVALFEKDSRGPGGIVAQQSFPSGHYHSLEAILQQFIESHRPAKLTHACFGVAGPVVEGDARVTNLKWLVNKNSLAEALKLESVWLINDLEATAYGIEELQPTELYTLNEGVEREGHRALIAAGTGLGMTGIFWDGRRYRPLPGEGGHMDFAPRNERELELLRYLTNKLNGHVSYERVLSGIGLHNIYAFLRDGKYAEEPQWLADEIANGEEGAAISHAATANKSELAVQTLKMFVEIYGAMAGNLALLLKPFGGLYVGGGIAPKILDLMSDGSFVRAYKDKGRMAWMVESVPVRLILDDKTALYGAARCALNAAS